MQIQRLPQSNTPGKLQGPTPTPPQNPKPEPEQWDKVSFDKSSNTYHFERPGHHLSVMRTNPLREGLTAAALVGIPSAFGAAEHVWLGGLGAAGLTAIASPAAGAAIGGTWGGVAAYRGSNKNPIFGALGALGGAGVGLIAFPLLKLPGVFFGPAGAAVAAAGLGAGVAVWSAVNNNKIDARAQAAGYKPE
ncbi:hypothetical protein ABS71_12560 [bacterium SCN 62-11]|nr:hypothetical protein [Candidatus Eremiobacteraeota bacterium]ODT64967.1 MAG: hypothetical protein ABS71_12560 [bacterium SCN 62-11]